MSSRAASRVHNARILLCASRSLRGLAVLLPDRFL